MTDDEDRMVVTYQGYLFGSYLFGRIRVPFQYVAALHVEDIPTGIQARVWGKKRAMSVMHHLIEHGNELINQYGVADQLAAEIYSMRREEAMAKIQVGDRVRLLVDIGSIKKGRVCKVVEVEDEPSFYVARGANAWDDEKYPVKVVPVRMATDRVALGPKDVIPLMRGEFGPMDMEVGE
jgi:hypothetical protein